MCNNQTLVCIVALGVLSFGIYIARDVATKRAEVEAEIEAKASVEKLRLEEHEATLRTKERMQLIPWYNATPEPAGK